MGVRQATAAALVPPRLPEGVNRALAVAQDAGVGVFLGASRGQAEGLDMAIGQADRQQRLGGVQSSGEDGGLEGQRAEVLEHGGRLRVGIAQCEGSFRDATEASDSIERFDCQRMLIVRLLGEVERSRSERFAWSMG